MDNFEVQKKELLQPLLFEAGAGLFDCQGFEFGIALLLFHLSRLGTEGLDVDKLARILDDKEKQTAGQLIHMLRKHVTVSDGIEQSLTNALAARNRLIHRILIDNVVQFVQKESRTQLIKEIRKLRSKVQKAYRILQPFISAFNKALDGVDVKTVEEEVRQRLS